MTVFPALDEERTLLGTSLMHGAPVVDRLVDHGLRPEHFLTPETRRVWEALIDVRAGSGNLDTTSVQSRFDTHEEKVYVDHLTADASNRPETLRELVDKIKRTALRRTWQTAAQALLEAADDNDERHVERAERLLRVDTTGDDEDWTPERLSHEVYDWLDDDSPAGIPTGFPIIDDAIGGGLRPGDVTALIGWTGHGKSLITDQWLTAAAAAGHRVHLLINEMSPRDRALRQLAQAGAARYPSLVIKKPTPQEAEKVVRTRLPYGLTDISAWPIERIARAIRHGGWDLVALDVLHNIPFRDTRDLDEAVSVLLSAARSSNTHLLLVCHLNDARQVTSVAPAPVLRDIRNTGMIARVCASVVSVHREQANDGGFVAMQPDGVLEVLKHRHGRPASCPVRLDVDRLAFVDMSLQRVRSAA